MDSQPQSAVRWAAGGAAFLGLLALAVLRSLPSLHYSMWIIDEQCIVERALGFLDGDLNPRWFGYNTLPMYLLATWYFVLYHLYAALGIVASKVEFAALLFSDEAVFFVSARLLFSLAHVAGSAVLSYILWRSARSPLGAVLFFAAAFFLPDAVLASNQVRVDTFVFLFLSLTLYFGCFAEKRPRSFFLALVFCSAAFASKTPAAVFFPVLFLAVLSDVRSGAYPKRYLRLCFLLPPLLVFLFMPYFFLDFAAAEGTFRRISSRLGGSYLHLGKEHHFGLADRLGALLDAIRAQAGIAAAGGTVLAAAFHLRRHPGLLAPFGFAAIYLLAFSTSATLDPYWLRPVYPLLVFFPLFAIAEQERLSGRWKAVALAAFSALVALGPPRDALPRFLEAARSRDEDTRVRAARWIEANLPEGSPIVLEGDIPLYLPRLFSESRVVTLANSYYNKHGEVSRNDLLSAAFSRYFEQEQPRHRRFHVRLLERNRRTLYAPGTVWIARGSYVVLSSDIYGRYDRPYVAEQFGELSANARAFYARIRSQKPVQSWSGTGPRIEIYQMKESIGGGWTPPSRGSRARGDT